MKNRLRMSTDWKRKNLLEQNWFKATLALLKLLRATSEHRELLGDMGAIWRGRGNSTSVRNERKFIWGESKVRQWSNSLAFLLREKKHQRRISQIVDLLKYHSKDFKQTWIRTSPRTQTISNSGILLSPVNCSVGRHKFILLQLNLENDRADGGAWSFPLFPLR